MRRPAHSKLVPGGWIDCRMITPGRRLAAVAALLRLHGPCRPHAPCPLNWVRRFSQPRVLEPPPLPARHRLDSPAGPGNQGWGTSDVSSGVTVKGRDPAHALPRQRAQGAGVSSWCRLTLPGKPSHRRDTELRSVSARHGTRCGRLRSIRTMASVEEDRRTSAARRLRIGEADSSARPDACAPGE